MLHYLSIEKLGLIEKMKNFLIVLKTRTISKTLKKYMNIMHIVPKTLFLFLCMISPLFILSGAQREGDEAATTTHSALQEIVTIMKNSQEKGNYVLILDTLLHKLLLKTPSKKVQEENITELREEKITKLIADIHELKEELIKYKNKPYVRRVNALLCELVPSVYQRSPGASAFNTAHLIYFTQSLTRLEKDLKEVHTEGTEEKKIKTRLDDLITSVATTFKKQEERITLKERFMLRVPTISALLIVPTTAYVLYKKVPYLQRFLKQVAYYVKRFFVTPAALTLATPHHITFKDIIGLDNIVRKLKALVELHLNPQQAAEAQKMGVTLPRGILFEGPPGVGKTMLAKAFANELKSNFFYASAAEFHCKWIGEGKEKLAAFFNNVSRSTPAVIFLDEIDAIGTSREEWTTHQDTKATLNELLTQMDGFKENPGIIVLAATNRANSLDTALLSRFSEKISFQLPTVDMREKILIHYMEQVPYIAQLPQQQKEHFYFIAKLVAQQTAGFSPRELQNFTNNSVRKAFSEGSSILTDQHFIDTLNETVQGAR